jgi:hypothetical protein
MAIAEPEVLDTAGAADRKNEEQVGHDRPVLGVLCDRRADVVSW